LDTWLKPFRKISSAKGLLPIERRRGKYGEEEGKHDGGRVTVSLSDLRVVVNGGDLEKPIFGCFWG